VQKLAGAILFGLVLLTGCKTATRRTEQPSSAPTEPLPHVVTVETNKPVREKIPPYTPPPQEVPANVLAPAPALTNPPLPTPKPATQPEPKWQSLNRWAEKNSFGTLRRVTVGPVESFALIANAGVLTLNIGSLSARWDNLDLRLGFAPQLMDGQVIVNTLDLRKNIEPLLRSFQLPPADERVIVIDPGHGGSNTGTRSGDGRFEKEFTLDWAFRLAPLLETNGWKVFLTRTNDVDVSLNDRVDFAEQQEADLFVSLHFNSPGSGSRDAAGLETYCLTPVGMTSSLTRGYEDNISQSFPNNAFDEQNITYAVRLHAALLKLGIADRGVRRARFQTVLRGHNRPAVLIEGGFLSNPAEARRIADPAFRQKLAEAIAEALK
jgi:N-acetylmuramoyl-L-alanine amidase